VLAELGVVDITVVAGGEEAVDAAAAGDVGPTGAAIRRGFAAAATTNGRTGTLG